MIRYFEPYPVHIKKAQFAKLRPLHTPSLKRAPMAFFIFRCYCIPRYELIIGRVTALTMADPLSIAASVLGVLDATKKTVQGLEKLWALRKANEKFLAALNNVRPSKSSYTWLFDQFNCIDQCSWDRIEARGDISPLSRR
jgi:hypothetical protein